MPETQRMEASTHKLLELVKEFEERALSSDELFSQNFEIKDHPIVEASTNKIPKSGTLSYGKELVKYQFHGNGCKLTFHDGGVVDFNYKPGEWKYDGFSVYAIRDYIVSKGVEGWDKSRLKSNLDQLVRSDVLYLPDQKYDRYRLRTTS